ncbi:MAG: hypothetical protein JNN01_20005 [Opitutaceae bacterium]|nr:hypothetical protein [Opitutaceae bacterium]
MSTKTPNQDRDPLEELLKSWKVEATLPPRFQEDVWRRIDRAEQRSASSISKWFIGLAAHWASLLRKPIGAAAYLSTLLIVGSLTGVWRSDRKVDQTEIAWRAAYLQAVVPAAPFAYHP